MLLVLSWTYFLTGKTSDLSLTSLQFGLKKSLSVYYAHPTENLASFSSSGGTYSSQSCSSTLTVLVANISLNSTGSSNPTKNTCLCMNLQNSCYGNSSVENYLSSTNLQVA